MLSRAPTADAVRPANRRNLLPAYAFLVVLAGTALFFRLGDLPLTGADEPRYARIADEMYRTGDWVTPRLQGDPWLEKPPLYYWLTVPFYALFGTGETTARMGPALCALAVVAAVCWAGTRLWSPTAGWLSGLITASGIGFCVFGRGASFDMPFTACFTAAFALLAVATGAAGPPRGLRPAAYALLGAATLAKGPLALILAAGIMFSFWVFDERGASRRRLHAFAGLALAAAVAAPWFWAAARRHGFSFVAVFFINHNLARYLSEIHHHAAPVYYYLAVVPGLVFPWSAWLLALAARVPARLRDWRRWDAGRLLAACWAVFPLLFFSLSGSKLPGYALVSVPPIALLMAAALADALRGAREPARRAGGGLHIALSCAVAAALPLVARAGRGENPAETLGPALAILPAAAVAGWLWYRGRWRAALLATAVQGLVTVLAVALFSFPMIARRHSTRDIAQAALAARQDNEPIVLYRFFHHTFHYYTGYRVAAGIGDAAALARFAEAHPGFLVVTEEGNLPEIRRIPGLSAGELAGQGKLRLLRLSRSQKGAPPMKSPGAAGNDSCMIAHHIRTGRLGERIACRFLLRRGYDVLARRFRGRRGEIDIVALEGEVLAFVEVKTRASRAFGEPWEFVDWEKRQSLRRTAEEFVARHGLGACRRRFDIVGITAPGTACEEITLLRDAWRSGAGAK